MFKLLVLIFSLFIVGCSESSNLKPHAMYRAEFSGHHILKVEEYIDTFAEKTN